VKKGFHHFCVGARQRMRLVKATFFPQGMGVARAVLSAGVALSSHAASDREEHGRASERGLCALATGGSRRIDRSRTDVAKECERRLKLEREIQAFEEWLCNQRLLPTEREKEDCYHRGSRFTDLSSRG
jgi:hypothetical protein